MGFLDNATNFVNTGLNSPMLIPAEATALQQWNQAGQYKDLGNQAADRADPFGQYRRGYGDQLQALYKDPSAIENTPGYKFTMNQALNQTNAKLGASGLSGSSAQQAGLTAQAAGLASQTWNTEANRLAMLSGAQFDPANAAKMQMEGGKLMMDAQSNALGAAMYPFGASAAPGHGGANGATPNYGNLTSGQGANQLAQAVMAGGAGAKDIVSAAMQQGIRFIQLPDGSTADLQQFAQHGYDNGDGQTTPYYPTQDAVNYGQDNPGSQFNPLPDYTQDGGTPIYQPDVMPPPDDMSGWNSSDFGGGFDLTGGWG